MLGGLALAGYAIIFAPPLGDVDFAWFRAQWGAWVWIEAVTFSALTITRLLDLSVTAYLGRRKANEARRILRMVPLDHPWPLNRGWWHLGKQQDASLVSQISMVIAVNNLSDCPVRITKVRLVRPKSNLRPLQANMNVPTAKGYSSDHPVPPLSTVEAHVHMLVRGALGKLGKPVSITLGITDQFGCEYRLKRVLVSEDVSTLANP